MRESVLVTGGAGFLGFAVTTRLVEAGILPIVADQRTPSWLVSLEKQDLAHHLAIRASEASPDLLIGWEEPPLYVLHLEWSGSTREAAAAPGARASASFSALHKALRWASTWRVPFIFASSAQVYSGRLSRPVKEEDDDPATFFGGHKKGAEAIVRAWCQSEDLPGASLRFFNLYGPYSAPQMILPRLLDSAASGEPIQIYGDGSQRRDYVSSFDASLALLAAARLPQLRGEAFNIGSGQSWSIMELVQLVERISGRSIPLDVRPKTPQDIPLLQSDSSRAEEALGWKARANLEEVLAELWQSKLKG